MFQVFLNSEGYISSVQMFFLLQMVPIRWDPPIAAAGGSGCPFTRGCTRASCVVEKRAQGDGVTLEVERG
jgi:hypothetical protein